MCTNGKSGKYIEFQRTYFQRTLKSKKKNEGTWLGKKVQSLKRKNLKSLRD